MSFWETVAIAAVVCLVVIGTKNVIKFFALAFVGYRAETKRENIAREFRNHPHLVAEQLGIEWTPELEEKWRTQYAAGTDQANSAAMLNDLHSPPKGGYTP